jgi:phenylacetate-CoA ligase
LGDPVFQMGITPQRGVIKTAKDILLRTDYRQAYHMDDARLASAVGRIRRRPGVMLLGYASSLTLIARTARSLGATDIRPRGIVSWGDKLFEQSRRLIEETFGTRVHDTYGCTEGFMIAGQCPSLRYHVTSPQVYLELLDDSLEREVPVGQPGHVVATRLDAYAMPLIRYYLGDLAVREDPGIRCDCGRSLPLLRQVIGRDTDIVRTRSGKYLIVHFFTGVFEHVPEIRQFRVLQRDLDAMEVEYIPDRGFTAEVLHRVEQRIHAHLHEPFPIRFREVDRIPPTASGKPQIVQSSVGSLS